MRSGTAVQLWLPAVVLVGATALALWPSLHSTILDENVTFQAAEAGEGLDCRQLGRLLAEMRGGGFQPLTWASLCVDRALWDLNPVAYHARNLALHALNAVLVYWLGLRLLRAPNRTPSLVGRGQGEGLESRAKKPLPTLPLRGGGTGVLSAFLAALLFALHPLRVEPVAWVAQRGVLLASLLALLTVLCYLRALGGGRRWWVVAFLCYAGSLAAGPWAAGLPLVLLALDVYPLRRHGLARILAEKASFAVLACAAIFAGVWTARPGFLTRLALVPYGFFFYLWKTLWPHALLPVYELPPQMKPLAPEYLATLAGLILAFALLAYYARRAPAVAVAAISYLLLLLPAVLLLQDDMEAAGDRYSYLASVPCMLGLGAGLVHLWLRLGRATAVVVAVLGLGIAAVLGVFTWRQAELWRTPAKLWTYADQLAPHSALVSLRLGQQIERAGEYERAVQLYRSAAETRPHLVAAQLALGKALVQVLNFKDAATAYRRALAVEPDNAEAHFHLGAALAASGEVGPAEQELKQAAALAPQDVRPPKALGHLYMLLGRFPEAVTAFRQAVALAPHDVDLQHNLDRATRAEP